MKKNRKAPIARSFGYAFEGIWTGIRKERNMKIHCVALIFVTAAGTLFQITAMEWCVCLLLFGWLIPLPLAYILSYFLFNYFIISALPALFLSNAPSYLPQSLLRRICFVTPSNKGTQKRRKNEQGTKKERTKPLSRRLWGQKMGVRIFYASGGGENGNGKFLNFDKWSG